MEQFLEKLTIYIDGEQDGLEIFIEEHITTFFDSPHLTQNYNLLKSKNFKSSKVKLIVAWLALLSGDNPNLQKLADDIDYESLTLHDQVLYMNLRGLSGIFSDNQSRLDLGKKAIETLPKNDHTFYMANAYLTYGQILGGLERIREAADYYLKAYEEFSLNHLYFPASVSLTNALLNLMRLGEFKSVINHAEHAMLIGSSYQSLGQSYSEILCLPIGMFYFEQHKPSLALEYLLRAKTYIDSMNLIHMHGYIEIYLLKTYHLLGDSENVLSMVQDAKMTFQNMNYPQMQIIITMGKILSNMNVVTEVERLEAYFVQSQYPLPIHIELLTYLSIKGASKVMNTQAIIQHIAHYRYIGDLVSLQQMLVLLADLYFRKNQSKECKLILEETVQLYHKNNLKSAFYLYEYQFWPLLQKIDASIVPRHARKDCLLTTREIDILRLIAQGHTNQSLGESLFISVGTVKWHINKIFSKLDVKNRIQAVEKAKKLNIL